MSYKAIKNDIIKVDFNFFHVIIKLMLNRWINTNISGSCMILGPRRAGKTTLSRNRFPEFAYCTLDDFDYLQAFKRDPKGTLINLGARVIIDEVQRLPELMVSLKYAIDQLSHTYVLTGSSSMGLNSSGSETLAGRIKTLFCPTFCWGEELGPPTHHLFEEPVKFDHIMQAQRSLEGWIKFGGFPQVVTSPDDQAKRAMLKDLRDSYFMRELAYLSNVENADGLLAILGYICKALGSHFEIGKAGSEAGLSYQTTRRYLNVLRASYLAFPVFGFHFGPAKRYAKAAKYYFSDSGILTALKHEVSRGQLLENFVISEIEKRRILSQNDWDEICYYKSSAGQEIDIILKNDQMTYAIEIKSTTTLQKKDYRALNDFVEAHPKNAKGILFYMGTDQVMLSERITALPVAHLRGSYI